MADPLLAAAVAPHAVIRERARTFYLASLFLPRDTRRDVHVVYAYFRYIDDLVDEREANASDADIEAQLDHWERVIRHGLCDNPLAAALHPIAIRHGISADLLCMIIDGARVDVRLEQVETLDELIRYSVLVAGSVGMVMATLMGANDEAALDCARHLGTAMQLTNVLRDVREDIARGRLYLPRTELLRRGCNPDVVRGGECPPPVREVMALLAAEARALYARGMQGIRFLPGQCQFSIYLSAVLYAGILDKIERSQFDVFSSRAHLGTAEKWRAVLPAYVAHRRVRTGSPG